MGKIYYISYRIFGNPKVKYVFFTNEVAAALKVSDLESDQDLAELSGPHVLHYDSREKLVAHLNILLME